MRKKFKKLTFRTVVLRRSEQRRRNCLKAKSAMRGKILVRVWPREVVRQKSVVLGPLATKDGNAKDNGSEKSHSRLTFYFFMRFKVVLFYPP